MFKNYGCRGIVIDSEKPAIVLQEIEARIRLSKERLNRRRYLIVTDDNNQQFESLFKLKELDYIADLLLMKTVTDQNDIVSNYFNQSADVSFEFFTHKYIGFDDNNQPVLINKWFSKNQSFLSENTNLYPDKFTNQHGRKFRLSTLTYPPLTAPVVDDNGKMISCFGAECSAAVYFAEAHNMTPFLIINDIDLWGEMFENFTGTGVQGELLNDNADIAFGALALWESIFAYGDFCVSLVRTGVTALVPAPKIAAGLLTPVYSFGTKIWIAVGCTLLITVIILSLELYFCNHNYIMIEIYKVENQQSLFQFFWNSVKIVYKILLSQSLTEKEIPNETHTKFIVTILMVYGLLITSLYSSSYSSIMTIPRYEHAIDTVQDLADSNIDWGGIDTAWIESIVDYHDPEYRAILERFFVATQEKLENCSKVPNIGFAMERFLATHYVVGNFIKKDVIKYYSVMKGDIYQTYNVMVTRKSSVLLPEINRYILHILEGGLVTKWLDMASDLYLDSYVHRVMKYPQKDNGVVKLRWSHLVGAFAFLLLGCLISTAVFIFEVFTYRRQSRKFKNTN